MNWHERFLQQARWTRDLRSYLFAQAGLCRARQVLEVGCGTGAILQELETPSAIHGIDLDPSRLVEAGTHAPRAVLACADALALPYKASSFEITFCHFLLLWVADPLQVLREMKRVTRAGGAVMALAEPDHEQRLDEPIDLVPLGRWQTEALQRQGADTTLGRRLGDLFEQAGIRIVETGSISGEEKRLSSSERALEWAVLEADLAGMLPAADLAEFKQLDARAWETGTRRLHVPTYFAHGVV